MISNRIFFVFLAVFTPFLGMGQNLFEVDEEREIIYVEGRNDGKYGADILSEMIGLINSQVEPDDNCFSIVYNEKIAAKRIDSLQVELSISFENVHIEGLKTLYEFSFEKEFFPQQIVFQYEVATTDGVLLDRRKFSDAELEGTTMYPIKFLVNNREDNLIVKVVGVDFIFTSYQLSNVVSKINLIESYVETFYDLEQVGIFLQQIELDKMVAGQEKTIEKKILGCAPILKEIDQRSFWEELPYKSTEQTTGYDLEQYYKETVDFYKFKKVHLEEALGLLHLSYMRKGMDFYKRKKIEKSKTEFHTTLDLQPEYAPARYMLALIYFEEKKYVDSEREIQRILNEYLYDENTRQETLILADMLLEEYTRLGKSKLDKKDKTTAKSYFEKAYHFCESTRGIPCFLSEINSYLEQTQE